MSKNYYKILGVDEETSVNEIKKAYRRLAHKFHPDKNKDPTAVEKFREIAQAYAVLIGKEKDPATTVSYETIQEKNRWGTELDALLNAEMLKHKKACTLCKSGKKNCATVRVFNAWSNKQDYAYV